MRKYKNYTNNDIISFAKEVKSLSGLLRKLGLVCAGGNYDHIRRLLQKLNVDCSHWTGQGWNKDKQLKDWSEYTRGVYLKPHLIRERGHKCENCSITNWLGELIKLEVHHIDGNKTNNKKENLQLLCPNCHSFTENYRKQKIVPVERLIS
jgi:5-methylcytosine-specific restriction endonuclease McrA